MLLSRLLLEHHTLLKELLLLVLLEKLGIVGNYDNECASVTCPIHRICILAMFRVIGYVHDPMLSKSLNRRSRHESRVENDKESDDRGESMNNIQVCANCGCWNRWACAGPKCERACAFAIGPPGPVVPAPGGIPNMGPAWLTWGPPGADTPGCIC